MRTIEVNLYQYDELSPKAQEKARGWFRSGLEFDPNYEPAETAAKLLGITLEERTVKLYGGGTRQEPDINYSVGGGQGDGADFTGTYEYSGNPGPAIREEFPTDTVLHDIAARLHKLQAEQGGYLITRTRGGGLDVDFDWPGHDVAEPTAEGITELRDILRSFADWIYRGLEADYDDQHSDDYVAETIRANDYEFTVDGERAKE